MTKDTENGEEQIGKDEQKIIDELVRLNIGMAATDPGNAKRGQHAKHHGCVTATFTLREDIPEHLRHGIFAESGSFDALIRFSNGKQKDDREPDAHGMAIKLLGRSETEPARDFVLVDNEVFFLANMAEYLFVNRGVAKSQRSKVSKGLFIVSLLLRPRLAIRLVKFIWHKPASPLKSHYWSTTPYRLGEHQAVKYMARSLQAEGAGAKTGVNGENGLSDVLVGELRNSAAAFEFGVHVQTDPSRQPIDDPTVNWSAEGAKFEKLARIDIPTQTVDPQSALAENLVFSPRHAREENRPIGAINQARQAVYEAMARHRHELNGVTPVGSSEPDVAGP